MNNNIKVIGVCGLATSGKDTFYSILQRLYPKEFRRFAFADSLKYDLLNFIDEHFQFNITDCSAQEKQLVRGIMIEYGMAKRAIDPDYWIKRLGEDLEHFLTDYSNDLIPVITDCRFLNEVKFFKDKYGDGFKLIEVTRADSKTIPPAQELENHPKLKPYIDFTIKWSTVGDDKLSELKPYVAECYETLFPK